MPVSFMNAFDANFYRAANTDLHSLSNAQALSHFQNCGLDEGREFSPFVNLNFYRSSNSDLIGFNNRQAFEHLQNYGVAEGRRFSPFVDLNFYRASNSDLAGFNNSQAFEHLQNYGVAEGRRFSQFFDINYYKSKNLDLVSAKLNQKQLLEHFELYGLGEGRRFSVAFDVSYYRSANSDLKSAGLNNQQLYEHFQLYGLGEGRPSSQEFNVSNYRAYNPDLVVAGLNNWQIYQHFVIYGQQEGRIGNKLNSNVIPSAKDSSSYIRAFGDNSYLKVTPTSIDSFNIQFDYRFDTNGFFKNPTRRANLEAAAKIWEDIIKNEFTDVPADTKVSVKDPQTNKFINFTLDYKIDDLVVFVGARNIGGSGGALAIGGPSSAYYIGSSLDTRYNSSDNFEPWTGSISFNTSKSWFFDATPNTSNDIPVISNDFLSVAVHELGHVLGIGTSKAFGSFIVGNSFYGPNAKALNGNNPIPLNSEMDHVQDDFLIGNVGSEAVMGPSLAAGKRKLPTPLDIALLADIGYQV
jgi:hypothetical protein